MKTRPAFFKHWKYYLFGKEIEFPMEGYSLIGKSNPLAMGVFGAASTYMLIYLNNNNSSFWLYLVGFVLWVAVLWVVSFLTIKPTKKMKSID